MLFPPFHFPLLREVSPLVVQGDNRALIGVIIFVGIVIAFIVIGGRSSAGGGSSGSSNRSSGTGRKLSLKKQGAALGLNKVHINTLENLLERHPVPNSVTLFSNPAILDRLLQLGLEDIEHQVSTEAVKESQKQTIFRIKQIVERNSHRVVSLKATKQLKPGQKIVINPETGGKYAAKIVTNLRDSIGLELPVDGAGSPVRLRKGVRCQVFFWKSNGQGFSFPSKVLGYTKIRGTDSLLLKHSNTVKEAQQRRFRRKELNKPCYFYPVRIMTTGVGKKQVKKAFIESTRGSLGTILEVSAGGCSLRTTYPLSRGELIKIDFETVKGSPISGYGKVVGFTKQKPVGGIMHIQFTRFSQKHLNRINSFVYEF